MYSNNPAINDTALSIINDGDGKLCGMTYAQRCAAADVGIAQFRIACSRYSAYRAEYFESRTLTRQEIIEAATIIQEYYREHNKERV